MDDRPDPLEEEASPERFDPTLGHHIWYEHWHRYHWAGQLARDKVVADVACGEGYGSDLLARNARRTIGIDADHATLESARRKYSRERLQFVHGDARALPLSDDSIDLLVSFETLEHLAEQEKMVSEIARVTRSDGLAVISTPDRAIYSPDGNHHNEHHVRELDASELSELLGDFFPCVRTFGQQFQCLSVIDEIQAAGNDSTGVTHAEPSGEAARERRPGGHVYLIAVCGRSPEILQDLALPQWHAFNDIDGALFAHYESQIRRLQDVDTTLEQTRRQLRESQAAAAHLAARLGY
ncbi:class I SAM-dependent methyltransferase [Wenzhouxiangella sp. EGI_FJ10409]|uniref:class I SAM-dependent methyltransferase n=1 Tax=Wenzhouxiangella sp. EGI_FJ10409 TaxID=3243767 RepID=UPI0035D99F52